MWVKGGENVCVAADAAAAANDDADGGLLALMALARGEARWMDRLWAAG